MATTQKRASTAKASKAEPEPAARKDGRGNRNPDTKAMHDGRRAQSAVAEYLNYLEDHKAQRGRPWSPTRRLELVDQKLAKPGLNLATKVALIQKRLDIEAQANGQGTQEEAQRLEDGFVQWAPYWSGSHGIQYATWRSFGVPPAVLKRAGIGPRLGRPTKVQPEG